MRSNNNNEAVKGNARENMQAADAATGNYYMRGVDAANVFVVIYFLPYLSAYKYATHMQSFR